MNVPTAPVTLPNNEGEKTESNRNPSWFKPGNNANPNGRPKKGYSISDAVKKMLSENPERKAIIIDRIMKAAEAGDIVATKLIWNYMDGMPTQKQEVTGKDGEPLVPLPILGGRSNE